MTPTVEPPLGPPTSQPQDFGFPEVPMRPFTQLSDVLIMDAQKTSGFSLATGTLPYWVDVHADSCAIGLLMLNLFDVADILISVHLDYLADLLAFAVSSTPLGQHSTWRKLPGTHGLNIQTSERKQTWQSELATSVLCICLMVGCAEILHLYLFTLGRRGLFRSQGQSLQKQS